jgi:hypothetical protein
MKRITFLFLAFFPMVLLAQDAQLKFWVNGTEYQDVLEIASYSRTTILVEDGAPRDGSVVYEFGPVNAYKVSDDGSRELVQAIHSGDVMNIPMLNFTLNPADNPDLMGYHLMEIEWVKRYNADKSVDELEIKPENRSIQIFLHE